MKIRKHVNTLAIALMLIIPATTLFASTRDFSIRQISEENNTVELIIGTSDASSNYTKLKEILTRYNGEIIENISSHDGIQALVAKIPLATTVSSLFEEMKAAKVTSYVEPNAKIKTLQFEPNDPQWTNSTHQWGPQHVKANWAWNSTLGSSSVLVAVVDSGIYYYHEDLNKSYRQGGYDWVNKDNDPIDDFEHGTFCAGIMAAEINNSKGIAGLAQVGVMAEKAADEEGVMKFSDAASAIYHATDAGAKIISMSWGFYYRSNALYNAIQYAYNKSVLLIAAVGNDNWEGRLYPAAFDEVVAVTAVNFDDNLASYSNYGDWVELAAPGGDGLDTNKHIWSTLPPWATPPNYGPRTGTSMACPHVAGVAALILSRFPNMTKDQLRVHLRKTADDLGDPGFDRYFGYGRVNANNSMQSPPNHDVLILSWTCPPYGAVNVPAVITANVHNYGTSNESNVTVQLFVNSTGPVASQQISSLASGSSTAVNLTWAPWSAGNWNVSCRVLPVLGELDTRDNAVWTVMSTEIGVIRVSPQSYRFNTIQKAVDAANPYDEIRVSNGTYRETVNIYKTGLRLIGENNEATIVDCFCGTPSNRKNSWGFIVSSTERTSINGFTVRNSYGDNPDASIDHSGVLLHFASHSVISNNLIKDNILGETSAPGNVSGVMISTFSGNITVTNNTIRSNNIGIRIYKTGAIPPNEIKYNLIKWNNKAGIELNIATNSIMHHNTIRENYNNGVSLFESAHNNTILHNIIKFNKIGISIRQVSATIPNTIKENLIYANNQTGISLLEANNNILYHNNFIDISSNETLMVIDNASSNRWIGQWGTEGNYWCDYNGSDWNQTSCSQGIGDDYLPWHGVDNKPLMSPWFPGDINHDGIVDSTDVGTLGAAWGSSIGPPPDWNWNPHADLSEDGIVDSTDLSILSEGYGLFWYEYWDVPP